MLEDPLWGEAETKRCPGCGRDRVLADFRRGCTWCRYCYRFLNAMRLAVPYDRILGEQEGACALCGEEPEVGRLNIDHLHVPPEERDGFVYVRGLLCGPCNLLIGAIEQRPHVLERIAGYLSAEPGRFYLPTPRAKRRHRSHGLKSSWRVRPRL